VLVPPKHHIVKKARLGLLIPGAVVWGASWLLSLAVSIGGGVYVAFKPANTCWAYASSTAWIPFIGPPIALGGQSNPALHSDGKRSNGTYRSCGEGTTESTILGIFTGLAVVDTIAQIAGATLTILGLTLRQTVVVPDEEQSSARLVPELYVSIGSNGSPLGLTVGLTGW
jgi:hypothetical protein